MQILPNTLNVATASSSQAETSTTVIQAVSPFASLLQRLADTAAAADSKTEDSLATARTAAQRQAGEHGIGQGLKMTREDFAGLREKLLKQGLSKEDVQELEDKVNSEDGLTWKGFLTFIADKLHVNIDSLGIELDASMKNELKALFQKLGFSLDESKELIQGLEDGDHSRVWQKLLTTIRELPADDLKNVTRTELNILAAAMRLPASSVKRIDSMLGGSFADSEPTPEGIRTALNVILAESAKIQKKLDTTLGDMRQLIEQGIRVARNRAQMESLADNRTSREVNAAKVLIENEARKNFRSEQNDLDYVEKGTNTASTSIRSKVGENKSDTTGLKDKANDSGTANPDARNPRQDSSRDLSSPTQNPNSKERADNVEERLHQSFSNTADKHSGNKTGAEGDKDTGDGRNSKNQNAWESFWDKVQTRGDTVQTRTMEDTRYFPGELSRTSQDAAENKIRENLPSQRILRTVQDGVLQNLREGGKQLTLRLDPPSLGKITVILQVHNKDVRAVLRTESAEVSKIINDQLGMIRQTLETQGLKVDKIDVQTQTPNEQHAKDWQGTEQHNQTQERERQEQMRSTLRTLRTLHQLDSPLAQDVQSSSAREEIAHHGLYVIA